MEKKNELLRKKDEKCAELDMLKKKTPSDLWIDDLDILLQKVRIVIFYYNYYMFSVLKCLFFIIMLWLNYTVKLV